MSGSAKTQEDRLSSGSSVTVAYRRRAMKQCGLGSTPPAFVLDGGSKDDRSQVREEPLEANRSHRATRPRARHTRQYHLKVLIWDWLGVNATGRKIDLREKLTFMRLIASTGAACGDSFDWNPREADPCQVRILGKQCWSSTRARHCARSASASQNKKSGVREPPEPTSFGLPVRAAGHWPRS